MFTGLIEEIGVINRIDRNSHGANLTISAREILDGTRIGDSIAVNGVCLTVVRLMSNAFIAEAMAETLKLTTLDFLRIGDRVNLERALQIGQRLGGHLVSGHVDGIGELIERRKVGFAWEITLTVPNGLERYIAKKGSLTLDGTSLTVIDVEGNKVKVGLIPHTAEVTILGDKRPGDKVNIEVDLLARYLEKLFLDNGVKGTNNNQGLTLEFLASKGFIK
ncbi:MAG: riboflavin synthase [Clostridia bacterium]|nr:riboflavin synthase [Clostridia bacterium]